jgi:hypothetical protein
MSAAVLDDYYAWIECLIGWIDDRVLVVGDIFGLLWRGAHFVVDWSHCWHWYWMFGEILTLLFHTLLYFSWNDLLVSSVLSVAAFSGTAK